MWSTRWRPRIATAPRWSASTLAPPPTWTQSTPPAYIGGAIAPGLEVSLNALINATAALRRVDLLPPRAAIGRNTVEAIQSGLLYGHAGLVDGLVDRLVGELGGKVAVVATGGLASTIVPHCRSVEIVDANLTLDGLRMIYEMNVDVSPPEGKYPEGGGGVRPDCDAPPSF